MPDSSEVAYPFGLPKCSLCWTFQEIEKWRLLNIPKAMFCVDEVITRKKSPLCSTTGTSPQVCERCKANVLARRRSGYFLEDLHFDPLDILTHPLIEDGAEKLPELQPHSSVAHTTLLVWLQLNQREKLRCIELGSA